MPTTFPIVLAHGIARFDLLRERIQDKLQNAGVQLDDSWHYFRNIKSHLEANGYEVHHASVSFAGGISERSRQLTEQVEAILARTQRPKVHIIGHSMGGLDARHMIVDAPGMSEKIATLTTIGTPHLGTTWADVALEFGGELLIDKIRPYLDLEGFRDLTTAACADFNRRAQDTEATNAVQYHTWSSSVEFGSVFWLLQGSWLYLQSKEDASDGLVSARSQAWTPELISSNGRAKAVHQHPFPFPADHLNQIGWWDPSKWEFKNDWSKLRQHITEFEDKIKAVYLEMAGHCEAAEAPRITQA
ncbi:MAG: alpha/beta fold hydrolase [Verrucomicrobiota bacterium]